MSDFETSSYYTRKEIHEAIGGGVQDFLPHKNGIVLCVCVKPEMNPDLPGTILVGEGEQVPRWARVFGRQTNFIPLFVKRAPNQWEYLGQYRVKSISEDPKDIAKYRSSSGRNDIILILRLEGEI